MIRYIHGSEDSLDIDVFYVFDEMPSFIEAQQFCAGSKEENRNIIVVNNGIVTDCFKGTADEINNGLFYTYQLHKQDFPLIIERCVQRDIFIKAVRVLRCLISHCSRTDYRQDVKKIMRSPSWKERVDFAKTIDFGAITDYSKNGSLEDVLKIFAFQLAQSFALCTSGKEIYTKSDAAKAFPTLRKYLYREINADRTRIADLIYYWLGIVGEFVVEENGDVCYFPQFGKSINLKLERYC